MSVVVAKGYSWVAARDGIAHAYMLRGRVTRTLCGLPALDPRYAWPASVRCADCTSVADGAKGPAPQEAPIGRL